jgi:hypothetical protein
LLALTVNSSDREESNFPHYLALWRRRIRDMRGSASGWRQMARKERRPLSVNMAHEFVPDEMQNALREL